ncbi:MAG: TetR/AcrR family transcriptional regulator [Ignavibacteriales bacterium]
MGDLSPESDSRGNGGGDSRGAGGESRGSETRERIIEEARALFAEKGFDGATIGAIARRAGIAEGTIYRHFESKQEMFFACLMPAIENTFSRMVPELTETEDIREYIGKAVRLYLELYEAHLESFNILFTEAPYHPELIEMLGERLMERTAEMNPLLEKMMAPGGPWKPHMVPILGFSLKMTLWAIVSFGDRFSQMFEKLGMPIAKDTLADDITDFLLYGLIGRPPDDEAGKDSWTGNHRRRCTADHGG